MCGASFVVYRAGGIRKGPGPGRTGQNLPKIEGFWGGKASTVAARCKALWCPVDDHCESSLRTEGADHREPSNLGRQGPNFKHTRSLGVNYWKLTFYLRLKLEGQIFGAVGPMIWWIWGGVRSPGAVAADIRTDSTLTRR